MAVKNILLIRLKSMGDVILTLPALDVVRSNFPSARITYLTSAENSELLQGFEGLHDSLILNRNDLRSRNPMRVTREAASLLYRLRAGHFSLVIDFQGYGETAWLSRLTGAPQRWTTFHHPRRSWAYTLSQPSRLPLHAAQAHLELLRGAGLKMAGIRNHFSLPASAVTQAQGLLDALGIRSRLPLLLIQPLTSGAHKNWPLDHYLAVAKHWQKQGMQALFLGGPADRAALQPVANAGFAVAAGQSLPTTAGLLQSVSFVLGGDTGAVHLAVAMGKPVLMLMRQSDPGSPIPFQHPDWTLTAPGPDRIAEIPVAEVNLALARRLSAPTGNVSG